MKKNIFFILSFLLACTLILCMTCTEEKAPQTTYYDVLGTGYVFMCDSLGNILYPLEGAEIKITTRFDGRFGTIFNPDPKELFFSDATGKYQVRFIKQAQQGNADRYSFEIIYYFEDNTGKLTGKLRSFTLSVDEIKNVQHTIKLDTFKVYINEIELLTSKLN